MKFFSFLAWVFPLHFYQTNVAAAVVGVASVAGGAMSANASKKAAGTQAQSAADATAAQERMFDKQLSVQEPWLDKGEGALNKLSMMLGLDQSGAAQPGRLTGQKLVDTSGGVPQRNERLYQSDQNYRQAWDQALADHKTHFGGGYTYQSDANSIEDYLRTALGPQFAQEAANPLAPDPQFGSLLKKFSMDDFEKDPGYDFRMNEGRRTLEGSAAARGGLFSGGAGKALERYGQDYGSSEYGKAFDRFNVQNTNIFNRLSSLAGTGQTSANQTGAAAQNFGNQQGSNIMGAGNAMAAGQVGSANAWSNAANQGYNAYQSNELMKRLQAPNTSGYGSWANSPMSDTIYSNRSLGD